MKNLHKHEKGLPVWTGRLFILDDKGYISWLVMIWQGVFG
jgi:hypothetical protein